MKSIFLFILAVSTLFSYISVGEFNAGVLPYAKDAAGEIYIMLGEEKGYWIDFIGRHDKIDGGELAETATREFIEETNCYFDAEDVKSKILKAEPIKLNATTYRFIIEIDKVNPNDIRGNRIPCTDVEKSKWCWIKLTDFLEAIDEAPDDKNVMLPSSCKGRTNKLHKIMRANLVKGTKSRDILEDLLK